MIKTLVIIFLISTISSILIVLGGNIMVDLRYDNNDCDDE